MFINSYFFKAALAAYDSNWTGWRIYSMPNPRTVTSAVYGNGYFLALSEEGFALKSTDGVTWVESALPYLPATQRWWSIEYGNGKFVALSFPGNDVAYSTDGQTWSTATMPASPMSDIVHRWWSIGFGGGKFVAFGIETAGDQRHVAAHSEDGITWFISYLPIAPYSTYGDIKGIAYGNGVFVALALGTGVNGEQGVSFTSADGITWTQNAMPKGPSEWFNDRPAWQSVAYGNGVFVAVTADYRPVAISADGYNWTLENAPADTDWEHIKFGAGRFAMTCSANIYSAVTDDGINWKSEIIPTDAWTSGEVLVYGNNKFITFKNAKTYYNDFSLQFSNPGPTQPTQTYLISELVTGPIGEYKFKQVLDFEVTPSNSYWNASAMDSAGTILVVGPNSIGFNQVHIFSKSGGSWSKLQTIIADDAQSSGTFGEAVDISADGTTLAISDTRYTDSGFVRSGQVSIYVKSGNSFIKQADIRASTPLANQYFGNSISLSADGNTLLTSTFGTYAKIYVRTGATWAEDAVLIGNGFTTGQFYGRIVKLSSNGMTAAVTAQRKTVGAASRAGVIHVFNKNGGVWQQQAELSVSDHVYNDQFGMAFSMSANGDVICGTTARRHAYVFTNTDGTWTQEQKIQPSSSISFFGFSCALSQNGGSLFLGSLGTVFDKYSPGIAYLYKKKDGIWTETQAFASSIIEDYNEFSGYMSMNADASVLAVTSQYLQNPLGTWTGAVEVFELK